MNENRTSKAFRQFADLIQRNVSPCSRMTSLQLAAISAKYERMEQALKSMAEWFESLKKEQDEKTMHGFKEACENWQTVWDAEKSFDMTKVQEALAFDPLK